MPPSFKVKKHWKGGAIRGYDIAEMIAEEMWSVNGEVLDQVNISAPKDYAGTYKVVADFVPTFSAKKVDI